MNKIEKIQQLDYPELINCLSNLAKRLGYSGVEKHSNSITAVSTSPLSKEIFEFILPTEILSGNVDIEKIANEIKKYQEDKLANVIFLVSNHSISGGFKKSISKKVPFLKINYIDRDELIKLIDDNYSDYWKHNDLELLEYEKLFCRASSSETEIQKLKIFNDKYQKLLDIFIDPRIYHSYEDKRTQTPVRKRIEIEKLIDEKKNMIISGDAGTGKTTLLRKIGEKLISKNTEGTVKNIPIFISITEIFEYEFQIEKIIKEKLSGNFGEIRESFFYDYNVILLVDSIDELDTENQKAIIVELSTLNSKGKIRYVIGTRNQEKISSLFDDDGFNIYQIDNFNNEQIKKFVSQFFLGKQNRADQLIDSLKENRIIERMPITPLTLSLISILYEENNLEIPATIADIYDNFNSLIIGRSTVTSRIQFIDISFKERILSLYALYLLEKEGNKPLTKDEFFTHFLTYYQGKTLPIKKGTLEEVLDYLIEHTGILVIKDKKWVKFSHDSYMEYYAAVEIFKHQREKENLLVKNFLNHHWQNSAIFYAGKSKDLPIFLENILKEIKGTDALQDCFMGVLGIGYLLQALYQTDNKLRKDAVMEALRLNISAYETMIKLAADNFYLFRNYKIPLLQLMNLMYFFENFNSLTLKDPLKIAFKEVLQNFRDSKKMTDGYKAVKLALTLDSSRINETSALSELIEEKDIFRDPSLYLLLDFSLEFLGKEKYKSLKSDIKKKHFHKISEPIRRLIDVPASRLRFTNLDTLTNEKRVKIIVEGKTDAEIIEHAYYVLTNGCLPYWKITSAGNEAGGAHEVAKALMSAKPIIDESVLIGIFDHDSSGLQEFRGLKPKFFRTISKDTLKKHVEKDIYGICIPIPGELDFYLQKDQSYNVFEIEHYFDEDILRSQGVLEECPISNVYKIKESKKRLFSKYVREQTAPKMFRNFCELFRLIDKLTNTEIEYEEKDE